MAKMNKKFVATSLTAAMVATAIAPVAGATFEDQEKIGSWATEAAKYVKDNNIMQGKGDGVFDPKAKITRAEFAVALIRALGLETQAEELKSKETKFTDVEVGKYYTGHIALLAEKGIIEGVGENKFDPQGTVTREQAAKMFALAFNLKKDDAAVLKFTDVSGWAKSHVEVLASLGVVEGTTPTTFAPKAEITREQFAVFTHRTIVPTVRVQVETTDAKVMSVTAINGLTLEVKFNKAVNATSALNLANYELGGTAISAGDLKNGAPTLSADGKTVKFTFLPAKALVAGIPQYLEISGIQDLQDKTIVPYKEIFEFNDKTAATVVGVTYPSNTTAVVEFSEPMKVINPGQVQVLDSNNQVVTAVATATNLGDTKLSIDTSNLEVGKTYTLKIFNTEDLYGNFAGTYSITLSKSSQDSTAPKLVSTTSVGLNKVKLTFDEPVKGTTGTISVNGGAAMTLASGNTTVSSDKKTLTVTLDAANTPGTAGLYTVALVNIEDVSGNKLASASLLTNFVVDTTAPKVKSTNVSNGKLYITFDESVTVQGVADMLNPVKYVSDYVEYVKAGNEVFVPYNPSGAAEYDTIVLDLAGFTSGTYTATLGAGVVKDMSAGTNSNDAATIKFDYTAADSTKPKVYDADSDSTNGYSGITQVGNAVTVVFDRELDPTTALNIANYTVDGVAVFKSAIFVGDKKTVKLTLNDNALAYPDTTKYNFAIRNVKSATGVTMNNFSYAQAFNNTVAPTVLKAQVKSSTTIELTFSKDVNVSANAFSVYIGGVKLGTATATNAAVTTPAKTLLITLPAGTSIVESDFTKGITVSANEDAVIKDGLANTNQLVNGVAVTATK